MPVSVNDLLDGFPENGGQFTLTQSGWEIALPELWSLLQAGAELVVGQIREVSREALSLAGIVQLAAEQVAVELVFACDQAREWVTGLSVRVVLDTALDTLAGLWGVDLTGVPEALRGLAQLSELTLTYGMGFENVVVMAQTQRLQIVMARLAKGSALVALLGLTDARGFLSQLPAIGAAIPGGDRVGVYGLEVIGVGPGGVSGAQGAGLNAAVAAVVEAVGDPDAWWPVLPEDQDLTPGVWLGAHCALPDPVGDRLFVVKVVPSGVPSFVVNFPQVDLGFFRWSGLGLSWPWPGFDGGGSGGGIGVFFQALLKLGPISVSLPNLGFDFLPDLPAFTFPRLPELSLDPDGLNLRFEVPDLPDLPDGILTGRFNGGLPVVNLLGLFDIEIPDLPGILNRTLPSLDLSFDLNLGVFGLSAVSGWLRFVLAALPSGPNWNTDLNLDWSRISLLGIDALEGIKLSLSRLPYIGDLLTGVISGFDFNGLTLAGLAGVRLPALSLDGLNDWIASLGGGWWPRWTGSSGGGSGGGGSGGWRLPGFSLDLDWGLPSLPPLGGGITWPPDYRPTPDLSWLDIPGFTVGKLTVSNIGLCWPPRADENPGQWPAPDSDWVLRLAFDARFEFGGFSLALPELGFDFDLANLSVHPRFPYLELTLSEKLTLLFELKNKKPWATSLSASWQSAGGVSAADIADFLGMPVLGEAVPEVLMPWLYSVDLHVDFESWFLVVAGTGGVGGWSSGTWVFATHPANGPKTDRNKLMALRTDTELKASDLPASPGTVEYSFDIVLAGIHATYAEQLWREDDILKLNLYLDTLNPPGPVPLPTILPGDLPAGLQLWGVLTAGKDLTVTLTYPDRDYLPTALGGPQGSGTDLLGFAIGAMRFSHVRLGLGFGLIYLAFDASMAIGPVDVDLIGLGIGIDKDLDARPMLQGASLELVRPPDVKIAAAFACLDLDPDFDFAMAGSGLIEIKFFSLRVLGSWAQNTYGWTSLFAYAELTAAKNSVNGLFSVGPVTFTGLALGFGINSTVRTPSVTDISRFPLVKRVGAKPQDPEDPEGGEPEFTPDDALEELAGPGGWVTPAQGQYWVAGGAQFTVYKFINARVLVLVEFGQAGWKAMLAGTTTLSLPPTVPGKDESEAHSLAGSLEGLTVIGSMGQVIVDFIFVYDSALGRFSMDAVIAEGSYILDKAAQLTGGISLYVWGKNLPERGISKGFVLSAGGYHPQFPVPGYYPRPPRIGWVWERGPITMKAQFYAALTDGAFMVGGAFAAVYDWHHGIQVQAWFTAHLDALVQWKPFYADLALGLSIGVSATVKIAFVRIRVSLELGVELQLWLPPVGGRAKVKVWFVSFNLSFGADREGALPVPWSQFQIQLPAPLRSTPKEGCELPDVTTGESEARALVEAAVLVRNDGFTVAVESALPASKITIGGELFAGSDQELVDIRPMRLTGVVCEQQVELLDPQGVSQNWTYWDKEGWSFEEIRDGVPKSLWGRPLQNQKEALNPEGLVLNRLTGVTIKVPAPELGPGVGPVSSESLKVTPNTPDGQMPLADDTVAGLEPDRNGESVGVITSTLVETAGARTAVHRALAALGLAPDSDGPLDRYAVLAGSTLTAPPYLTATSSR